MSNSSEKYVPSIFVSYRIADTLQTADRLAAGLQGIFGPEAVFFDRRTIEPGDTWDSNIESAVKGAAVVLVLIGKKWLTEQDEYGRRRLDVSGDWVRREVETALVSAGSVIPVLVDKASLPPKAAFDDLPSISALSSRQAAHLRIKDWDTDFSALVEKLAGLGMRNLTGTEVERPIIPGRIATRGPTPFIGRSAELDELAELLPAIGTAGVVVVRGMSGVGKSEVAREYARRNQAGYTNGAFFIAMEQGKTPVDLATYGRRNLGLDPGELKIEDQCTFVLRSLEAPTLLVYDNVADPEVIRPWLPADDECTHVLITTTWEDWDQWPQVEVLALGDKHAMKIVEALGGSQVLKLYGEDLVANAAGLPIQLCPATRSVAKALRRYGDVQLTPIAGEAEASFAGVWDRLEPEGRLVLAAATLFNPDRIRPDILRDHLLEAAGWSGAAVDAALDACMDLSLFDPGEKELRLHRLLREFVRSAEGADIEQLLKFRDVHAVAFVAAARASGNDPSNGAIVTNLLSYPLSPEDWSLAGHAVTLSGSDCHSIGYGLSTIGLFVEARPWYERAVAAKEQGDIHGRVDHESLGNSLHQVGYCLSMTGDYEGARPWFERAVAEKKQGDIHGRVDHESLGSSLHQVGSCLDETGDYEGARSWYERAVAEAEQGDIHGRVDHVSLGRSLHQVGYCLSMTGGYEGARTWYERAVAEKEQGDIHGRVDHDSLRRSLHQVGSCLSMTGDYEGARPWYERAVAEAEQGDIHGRVDHESLGSSLHQVGSCLDESGDYEGARTWYERAIAEKEQGDIHARVDHASLGRSLHQVGYCLFMTGDDEGARPWYERAVAEKEQGDIHGRVDLASIEVSKQALERLAAKNL